MKRKSIAALGAALVAGFMSSSALAQVSDNVVRISILNDMTGIYADAGGKGSIVAAELAAEDFGGKVAGAMIEVVSGDHANKPDIASNLARKAYDAEGVDVIADGGSSAAALAMQNVSREKKKIILLSGPATAEITGKACSPYSFHWMYDTYALAAAPPEGVLKRGGDTWFFITADYAFGKSMEAEATKRIQAGGGKIVGGVRAPLDTPDFSSYLLQAQGSDAKVMALATAGSDTSNAIKQAQEYKVIGPNTQVVTFLMFINDVNAMGLKDGQGLISSTTYYHDLDDGSRKFAKRFWDKMGRPPSIVQAGVYSSVLHYLKAIAATNTDDADKVAAKMREMPVEDGFTHGAKIRADGRLLRDLYVTEVKKPEESKGPWDYWKIVATIPGDKAWRPVEESKCPLLKTH
ncbi:branched-chain amino acid transport system substrate-binding protein [Bradyrhizobium sp. USDA 4524]|uniref:ABC transporter substrate-binding protein n=1 Tax=Bradyrhizobium TaxID=374 RepID=UPI0020A18C7E|nr:MULTISPECIES: ABC transporter substrate-binding protein [Bradyrhizobium]MCP1845126.1 branched-chain amino acid transport system substrate-binding protein [Bradyrhizobium sp. USDA 4538]MCP1905691.1 branched-chain amino acid transport system substrate-binding protein [Bradyrhizobium sp. USDA 4537]MCP1988653.1 branched-chain amino acid transport system substrate-binding protein [Bradyrhizobium sp. USDA 4539]MCP3418142.1 ABC transporter substrate-binding protein [Bradyrhizobium brasilense]